MSYPVERDPPPGCGRLYFRQPELEGALCYIGARFSGFSVEYARNVARHRRNAAYAVRHAPRHLLRRDELFEFVPWEEVKRRTGFPESDDEYGSTPTFTLDEPDGSR